MKRQETHEERCRRLAPGKLAYTESIFKKLDLRLGLGKDFKRQNKKLDELKSIALKYSNGDEYDQKSACIRMYELLKHINTWDYGTITKRAKELLRDIIFRYISKKPKYKKYSPSNELQGNLFATH